MCLAAALLIISIAVGLEDCLKDPWVNAVATSDFRQERIYRTAMGGFDMVSSDWHRSYHQR